MRNAMLFYIIVPLFFGAISYIASENFIVMGVTLTISLVYFLLFFMKRHQKYKISVSRFKSCYTFINSFIISLSIKLTIPAALESTLISIDSEAKGEFEGIGHLSDNEKLDYLKKYYHFHTYELFLNIVSIYDERGGNILDLSTYLLNESRNQHEYLIRCESMGVKKWIELSVLWFLSLAIMVILRFALSQFFSLISKQLVYHISIVGVFVLALVSIEVLARKSFSLELKGWGNKR